MDCAAEEGEIRHALRDIAGIQSLRFHLGARTLVIGADEPSMEQAISAIRKAGFDPKPIDTDGESAGNTRSGDAHEHDDSSQTRWGRLGSALGLALLAEIIEFMAPESLTATVIGMALALGAILLSGMQVYVKGIAALRNGRLNINALMSVAVTGAFLIGEWPEAGMVMALYAIAEAIEAQAVDRARNAIAELLSLAPRRTDMRQADGSWIEVDVDEVVVESVVRVRPGQRIPLDGVITQGSSALDQSAITGESLPVDKGPGDSVFAGTINQTAALELRVSAVAADSTLARIIEAVEQAQSTRAPTQRFVDRFAAIYTPAVFVLSLLIALVTPLTLGWGWLEALYTALVMLVIACPCALVISTPVTVVSGLAAAARRGILIKGGAYLESAYQTRAVALDKTGTLTEGRPRLVAFERFVERTREIPSETLAVLARSLASRSDHPVSKAITQGLGDSEIVAVENFEALAGRGVQGTIDGQTLVLGNHRWIEERQQCCPELEARLAQHEQAGRTVSLLASTEHVLALCIVADTIKPTSTQAIAELKQLGVTPVMLTGDNRATGVTIAAQAGIDEVRGDLLPEEKQQAIQALQQRFGMTAMAGDGINDAPALAQADIGFAMGAAGTDIAAEAADIVVMNDDLRRLPETIRLSRRTHQVLWQNISLALGIKAVFLLMAVLGHATMWMAVFADMGASLLVVFNGLRLLRNPDDAMKN